MGHGDRLRAPQWIAPTPPSGIDESLSQAASFMYLRSSAFLVLTSYMLETKLRTARAAVTSNRSYPIEVLDSDLRELHTLSRAFLSRRRHIGLPQAHVARSAGVSVQWLSAFENAKGDFGIERIMRVAEVLGLSLAVHDRPKTDIDIVFEELRGEPQE